MNENLFEAQYDVTKKSKLKKFYEANKILIFLAVLIIIIASASVSFYLEIKERNKILLYLIDGTDETPYLSFKTLENEILQFNPDLDIKPVLICRTKSDIGNELAEEWGKFDQDILVISAVSGDGLETLISALSKAVQ